MAYTAMTAYPAAPTYQTSYTPAASLPTVAPNSGAGSWFSAPSVRGTAAEASTALLANYLDNLAAKRTAKEQTRLANEATALQGQEFDKRLQWMKDGNANVSNLLDREHTEGNTLQDQVFAHLMSDDQSQFQDVMGVNANAFDKQMTALDTLTTAQRAARLEQLAYSDAEKNRQLAFQADADAQAAALPGQIGYNQQMSDAADAASRRASLRAYANGPETDPSVQGDSSLSDMFARAINTGKAQAATDAANKEGLDSYSDAFQGADRRLGDFAGGIARLTDKAAISRSALPSELAIGAIKKANAKDAFDFATALAKDEGAQKSAMLKDYYGKAIGAEQARGQNLQNVLDAYFGNSIASRNALTQGYTGASNEYTTARTNNYNAKIQGTTTSSPLSSILKIGAKVAGAYFGAGG